MPRAYLTLMVQAPIPVRKDGAPGRDWAAAMMRDWVVGEQEARRVMAAFVNGRSSSAYTPSLYLTLFTLSLHLSLLYPSLHSLHSTST